MTHFITKDTLLYLQLSWSIDRHTDHDSGKNRNSGSLFNQCLWMDNGELSVNIEIIFSFRFQYFNGYFPLLTKGPWAMFFGGPELEQQLTTDQKPADSILYVYVISIILNLVILISKKIYSRKIERDQKLRDIIVGNLTNVLTISVVSFLLVYLTISLIHHHM